MTIYERIKQLRIQRGMSQIDLAKRVGYKGRSAISKVENGERDISQTMIVKYAEVLGVSPTYLLFGKDSEIDLPSNIGAVSTKRFPLLGKIACGEPIYAEQEFETYIDASSDIKADFCLTANGDSMIGARIYDGDVVFIKKQDIVENGEIAAVIIDDEATLKRWYYDSENSTLILSPENPAYRPLVYQGEALNSVRCLGKAVSFMSKL